MKNPKEKQLYPIVQRWLKRHFRCFHTDKNTGLKYSRVDVVGVRDVGGDLSGEVESIVVEVKRGTEPFATASGQALGYRVYANRVYLADYRSTPFTLDETQIASHLGIGLIQISGSRCKEILSSPYYRPITKLNLALMEKLGLGCCQVCNSMFVIGDAKRNFTNLTRENWKRAFDNDKGLMFWNREVAKRKNRPGFRPTKDGTTYERRFICRDCVEQVFSKFKLRKEE
jgi:hypothetical protein